MKISKYQNDTVETLPTDPVDSKSFKGFKKGWKWLANPFLGRDQKQILNSVPRKKGRNEDVQSVPVQQ